MYAETPHPATPAGVHQYVGTPPGSASYDAAPPMAPQAAAPWGASAPQPRPTRTNFVTGAYMPSGDPAIDRMLRLERALKQHSRGF